jgi:hypothetical protein
MILHGNTLISLDLLEKEFVCNLTACKGACCVEGESGAPLLEEELALIDKNLEQVKPFMSAAARQKLEQEGSYYETDFDGDLVTRCMGGRDCIFAMNENGVYKCAIEKAWEAGQSDFKKPVSCHLYPIRIAEVGEYEALNYNRWEVCSPACSLGAQLQVPVYKFLKDALIRRYGQDWYDELEAIAAEFLRSA